MGQWAHSTAMKSAIIAALILATTATAATEWVPANTPCPAGMFRMGPLPMTGSMRPAMYGGEFMYCERYTGQAVAVGDIIAIDTARGGPRTHRVTAINGRTVWTAGDACRRGDGANDRARIMWVVRYVLRTN